LYTDSSLIDSRPVRLPYAPSNRELWKLADDFQKGVPATATADFGRNGLLRVDYVLPSKDLTLRDAKVFWPGERDPRSEWTTASDHHLVWIDVVMP
jgi:endonuclease/exonuclease/phosphatase family metal-dependent hydrolase